MTYDLQTITRPNVWALSPYSSARSEFQGEAEVFVDANESPYNPSFNRYPDPLQLELKQELARAKGVAPEQIFLGGAGSDEAIDLLYRAFCEPQHDNVVAIAPSYGMYKVAADINNVDYRRVLLNEGFDFAATTLLAATNERSKIVWLCSPNNPTGNSLNRDEMLSTIEAFSGIVVVDEAYIDFAQQASLLPELHRHPNLVVLQTFSKAWASAGVRLGMAFASPEIVSLLNKIKYPYNVNVLTQRYAIERLRHLDEVSAWVNATLAERDKLREALQTLPCVRSIYPSDANFLLVKMDNATAAYRHLVQRGVVTRNRSSVELCHSCLRITVGAPWENERVVGELHKFCGSAAQ
jgi:histidinol-phosphate aminotransferase